MTAIFHASILTSTKDVVTTLDCCLRAARSSWRADVGVRPLEDPPSWNFQLTSQVADDRRIVFEEWPVMLGADSKGNAYFISVNLGIHGSILHGIVHDSLCMGSRLYEGEDAERIFESLDKFVPPGDIEWP